MMIDYTLLRRAAEAATPGPWVTGKGWYEREVRDSTNSGVAWCGHGRGTNEAAFIAAANPAVILALLDEIERLREGEK